MKVYWSVDQWQTGAQTVATIGNFDGVHLGHQAILRRVVEGAVSLSLPSVVLTFDPVPKKVLQPEKAPPLIQTLPQRLKRLEACGVHHTIVVAFNHAFAAMEPQQFVQNLLVERLRIRGLVVGRTFSFGHQKKGNIDVLQTIGRRSNFFVEGIPEIEMDGVRVSSTLIRQLVLEGQVEKAASYLGEPFCLSGKVAEGKRLGQKIGIPTANLAPDNELIPGRGVYITRTLVAEKYYPSVTNVGFRPTFEGQNLTVETHFLHYHGADTYGQNIEVEFLRRLRDELKFTSIESLKSRILQDIDEARAYFKLHPSDN